MRDSVTSLIENYDSKGRYLDRDGVDQLKSYFETGTARVEAATVINSQAASLVKQAAVTLFAEQPELIRP
ncbi:MAG: allophycocyanin subunit beta, partial [Trichodesmium sp.]